MNKIINKFLLAGDKFIPEMHLRQPGITHRPFTNKEIYKNIHKERIQKIKETEDLKYIYQNEIDKACFQHGRNYGDFKDLTRRTASDKILRDKAFIAKNPKYDGYQSGLASMVYNFFDKKSASLAYKSASGGAVKSEIMSNQ